MSFRNHPSENSGADHCNTLKEALPASGRFAWRISPIGGTLIMAIVVGAGSMALFFFASYLARQDRLAASDNEPGGGIMIRSEVIRLYLPRTLIELAKR
jgi:hypothetical protein